MTFDSEEYWGLDEAVVGDGTTDELTRSLSEAVERRYDANNKFLKSRDWKVTFNPFTKNPDTISKDDQGLVTDARRLACFFSPWGKSTQFGSDVGQFLFTLPVFIHPDTEKFRITMRGEVVSFLDLYAGVKLASTGYTIPEPPNDQAKSVRVRAYLSKGFEPKKPEMNLGNFFGETSTLWNADDNPVQRISVSVARNVQHTYRANLMLEINTNVGDHAFAPPIDELTGTEIDILNKWQNHILNMSDSSNPDTDIQNFISALVDDNVVMVNDGQFEQQQDRYQVTRPSDQDRKINVQVKDPTPGYEGGGDPNRVSAHFINSVVPQSWTFESFSDKTTDALNRYSDKTLESMQANQVVSGADISNQAGNLDYNYVKPRLKAIGPKGRVGGTGANTEVEWGPADTSYQDNVHKRWNFTNFAAANTSPTTTNQIDRLTFRGDKGNARYRVITTYALVSYWQVLGVWRNTLQGSSGWDTVEGHWGMRAESSPSIDEIRLESGVNIDFGYQLKQRGSSATGEVVADKTVPEANQEIFIANIRNRFPLLRTIYESYWTDPDGQDNFDYSGDEFNSNENFVFREGWIDRFDLGDIVRTVEHTIELPNDSTTDFDRPFELVSYLSDTSNVTAEYRKNNTSTIQHPDNRIVMVTLQTAVYEEGV